MASGRSAVPTRSVGTSSSNRPLRPARFLAVVAAAVAVFGTLARAGDAPVPSDPVFKAILIDSQAISGRIAALGPGSITLAIPEGAPKVLEFNRLFKLTRDATDVLPAVSDRSLAVLPEGDVLARVNIGAITDTNLEIRSDSLGKLSVPLDCVLGLIVSPPPQTGRFEQLWDRLLIEPRNSEVAWLTNGDRLGGGLLALDEQKLQLQVDGKPVDVDRAGLVAVGLDPANLKYPRPDHDFLEFSLKDGSRLGVTDARLESGNVLATTRFGQAIKFPLVDLVRIAARTSKVVYLSERKPAGSKYVSYVGPTRGYRADRTVDGHLFQLGGQTFDRGIGTQSRTLIGYRIEPGDKRFQATIGVDERAGPLGSVAFVVLVDGKEKFRTSPLSDRDQPRVIDVEILGGKSLILSTEFGDRGDIRDLADWVEARIVR